MSQLTWDLVRRWFKARLTSGRFAQSGSMFQATFAALAEDTRQTRIV